jgi:hypothetical protein
MCKYMIEFYKHQSFVLAKSFPNKKDTNVPRNVIKCKYSPIRINDEWNRYEDRRVCMQKIHISAITTKIEEPGEEEDIACQPSQWSY